jgi:hypothetical protein
MLYGDVNKRMKDIELILRFFALLYKGRKYESPMKVFLNKFMGHHRHLKHIQGEEFEETFEKAIETAANGIGHDVFKLERQMNASLFDAVMVGIARRLKKGPIKDYAKMKQSYHGLLENEQFRDAILSATANESKVLRRLRLATKAFVDLK